MIIILSPTLWVAYFDTLPYCEFQPNMSRALSSALFS